MGATGQGAERIEDRDEARNPARAGTHLPGGRVDIAATRWSTRYKPLARATRRPGVMGGLGGFGALFDPKQAGRPCSSPRRTGSAPS